MDYSQELLREIRALREDINELRTNVLQRISMLESEMEDLQGNGQPGRMSKAEQRIARLMELRWWLTGAGAVVGSMVVLILHFAFHVV